ncbi:MAG: hypothetical protein ACOX02_03370 [Acholeplasmatales bacterium]
MNYDFDWNYVKAGSPYVTISSLAISFNSLAIKQLGSPERVKIGFDEENIVIAIKSVEQKEFSSETYLFSPRTNKDGWIRIGCKEFIKRLEKLSGYDFSKAKRFSTEKLKDDMIIIKILKQQ